MTFLDRRGLQRELSMMKEILAEARGALREHRTAVLARLQAEAEVRAMYREREIARSKATERDITRPLNKRRAASSQQL